MTDAHDLEFEARFWGDCCNTFDEEQKHYVYARYMGLHRDGYGFRVHGRILDVGGGPASILLKSRGTLHGTIVCDPLMDHYPEWVRQRYQTHYVRYNNLPGEKLPYCEEFSEVWLYNCLQHTEDPSEVLANCWRALVPGGVFRFFEWVNIPPHEGHPHMITRDTFAAVREQASGSGACWGTCMGESGCVGDFYAGWLVK